MRIKFKEMVRGWGVFLILIALAGSSFGATFNITTSSNPCRNHDGSAALTPASIIRVFRVVGSIDRPNSTGVVTDDQLVVFRDSGGVDITANLQFNSSGNVDFFGLADISGSIYVRIWERVPGSGATAYYKDVSYSIAGTPVETVLIGGQQTTQLNNVPPAPSINSTTLSEKLARRPMPSEEYDLQLKYDLAAAPADGTYRDSHEMQVKKRNGAWADWPTAAGPNFFTHSDGLTPINVYYERGRLYRLRARSVNHLGEGAWSGEVEYQALAAGAGVGAETSKTWTFRRPSATGTGINTLAIPFTDLATRVKDRTDTLRNVSTVQRLIYEINRQAGGLGNVVSVFGWYDAETQVHKGLTNIAYNPDNSINSGACTAVGGSVGDILGAAIISDNPYQATTNLVGLPTMDFTLKGYK